MELFAILLCSAAELELQAGRILSGGRIIAAESVGAVTGRISISRLSSDVLLLSADPVAPPDDELAVSRAWAIAEMPLEAVCGICAYSCVLKARTRASSLASRLLFD